MDGSFYRAFGVIANIALALNLIIMIAVMSILGSSLTLPGIAGIVLTIGMAVDANVLIFERMREELANGVKPKSAIVAGFDRAFSSILMLTSQHFWWHLFCLRSVQVQLKVLQ